MSEDLPYWERHEREARRQEAIASERMMTRATIAGGTVFVICWVYCSLHYGFLFGFGLGWLPSAILGGVTFLAVAAYYANRR